MKMMNSQQNVQASQGDGQTQNETVVTNDVENGLSYNNERKLFELKIDALKGTDEDRYYYLYPLYGEEAYSVVSYFTGQKNSQAWRRFKLAIESGPSQNAYFDTMRSEFELDKGYTKTFVTVTVQGVREICKQPLFDRKVPSKCIEELMKVYITEVIGNEETGLLYVPKLPVRYWSKDVKANNLEVING